jgi:predicted dehydrogenase
VPVEPYNRAVPPLRFGIVGLGRAAAATAPSLARRADHFQIVALADTGREALERFGQQYPARTYPSIEALCADPEVDAVYIATPTHLHTGHVLVAAEHGKHIIVEKPLAISLADAERMIEGVERAGVCMIVGHSQSYEPPIRAIRDLVSSQRYGRLRMINGWYFNDWLYRPRLPAELDTAQGGGVVFRQGAHHFDIARLIGGGLVRSVRAVVGAWDTARPTEGSYSAQLEFQDGVIASLTYSGYDHFHTTELTGVSEGGTRVDRAEHGAARRALAAADDRSLKNQPRPRVEQQHQSHFGLLVVSCDHADIRQSPDGLLVYADDARLEVTLTTGIVGRDHMVEELYAAVTSGTPPLHSPRWARATLEVSLAVLTSARTRQEVLLQHQVAVP